MSQTTRYIAELKVEIDGLDAELLGSGYTRAREDVQAELDRVNADVYVHSPYPLG